MPNKMFSMTPVAMRSLQCHSTTIRKIIARDDKTQEDSGDFSDKKRVANSFVVSSTDEKVIFD